MEDEQVEQEPMTQITFSVPSPLLQKAKDLALHEGWRQAELFRIFWEKGFADYAEGSNKRLVNSSLRKKEKEAT